MYPNETISMKSFLILIFSKLFMFSKNIGNSDDDSYAFKAVGIFTVFLSFNIFTIVAYYKCLIIKSNAIIPNTFISLLLVFIIGFSLYLFFIKEKRYIKIYNQFIPAKRSLRTSLSLCSSGTPSRNISLLFCAIPHTIRSLRIARICGAGAVRQQTCCLSDTCLQ